MEDNDSAIKAALQVLAKNPDEHDKFGEYVACELRSLKFDVRKRLKMEIRKAILSAVQEDVYFMHSSSASSSCAPTPPPLTPSSTHPTLLETPNANSCSSAKDEPNVQFGETGANKENIIQGQMDVPLSEAGLKQAHLLGHRLQNQKYTHIFASDLSRAKQTAQTILEKSHYSAGPIVQDSRLRERKFGEVEGKTFNELKRLARRANQSVPSFTPSGAETVQQVRHRAVLFFQEICQLLLKSHENGIKEQSEHDYPSNGIESDINRIHVGTGGVKRRRHSSLICGTEENGIDHKDSINNGVQSVDVQRLKRERSELLSSDDETSLTASDLLKTAGKHLEALSSNCHHPYKPVGQDCSSDQLCVYVPSRISKHEAKKDERIKSNYKPNHLEHQTVTAFHDNNFPSTFKDPTTFKLYSPSAMHDRMNGDCPNVSLSPLSEHSLSWQSLSELHRKTSVDSSNDELDVSPALTANVLIVSHGGLLRELIRHFVEDLGCTIPGGKGQAFRISPNTGLSKFTVSVLENDDKPKVICLLIHDKDHLVGNEKVMEDGAVL